jgi:hypothetical protein
MLHIIFHSRWLDGLAFEAVTTDTISVSWFQKHTISTNQALSCISMFVQFKRNCHIVIIVERKTNVKGPYHHMMFLFDYDK